MNTNTHKPHYLIKQMKKVNIFLVILLLMTGCGGNKPSGNDGFITVDVMKSYPKKINFHPKTLF